MQALSFQPCTPRFVDAIAPNLKELHLSGLARVARNVVDNVGVEDPNDLGICEGVGIVVLWCQCHDVGMGAGIEDILTTADVVGRKNYPHYFVAVNSAVSRDELESLCRCKLVPITRPIRMR
jgi:hypothetical protein